MPLWSAGMAQHVFAVDASLIAHRAFQSHLTLANLGIDGDSFKVHLQWQLLAGLWRMWEHTAEWGWLETWSSSLAWAFWLLQSLLVTPNCCSSQKPYVAFVWWYRLSSLTSVASGQSLVSPFSLKNNIGLGFSISFHLGSIALKCDPCCVQKEGHLAEWLSHSTVL